ncbi:MAG: hypothetical protein R3199_05820 [Gemmatimonadota bacterium]|nr:hypothetical protein [Gemmatimonadota bacterium]
MNRALSSPRPSPLWRATACVLALLYLTIAAGAGFHAGDHADGPLEWLPLEFHHHAFQLDKGPDREAPRLADECLACELTRLSLRLPALGPALAEVPPPASSLLSRSAPPTAWSLFGSSSPRAPPLG